jgi:hypothetical protein
LREETTSAAYQPPAAHFQHLEGRRIATMIGVKKQLAPGFSFQKTEPTATHYVFDMANPPTAIASGRPSRLVRTASGFDESIIFNISFFVLPIKQNKNRTAT